MAVHLVVVVPMVVEGVVGMAAAALVTAVGGRRDSWYWREWR